MKYELEVKFTSEKRRLDMARGKLKEKQLADSAVIFFVFEKRRKDSIRESGKEKKSLPAALGGIPTKLIVVNGFASTPIDPQFACGQLSQFNRDGQSSRFSILAGGNLPKTVGTFFGSGMPSLTPAYIIISHKLTRRSLTDENIEIVRKNGDFFF